MELSEDDVLHILKLIDESKFDYFQLEVGELKITVSKGEPIPIAGTAQPVSIAPATPSIASVRRVACTTSISLSLPVSRAGQNAHTRNAINCLRSQCGYHASPNDRKFARSARFTACELSEDLPGRAGNNRLPPRRRLSLRSMAQVDAPRQIKAPWSCWLSPPSSPESRPAWQRQAPRL